MDNSFTHNIVSLAESNRFVSFLHENNLYILQLVTKLLLLDFLGLNLSGECFVFGVLLLYLFSTSGQTFLGLSNQRHHSFNFWNQNVFLFLLGLGVLIFTFYFGVFELTYLGLERLVSVIDLRCLFLCLLELLLKRPQLVLVFLLLLLSFFEFEAFWVKIKLYLLRLLLNLSFFGLVQHKRLVHLIELLFVDVASEVN